MDDSSDGDDPSGFSVKPKADVSYFFTTIQVIVGGHPLLYKITFDVPETSAGLDRMSATLFSVLELFLCRQSFICLALKSAWYRFHMILLSIVI